jgi:serine/threonine protein kinase
LINKLGSGSFASVWLAYHVITNFHVAIKIVNKETLNTPESMTRFNREINLLKKIDHPFISQLFEVFDDQGFFYLVMEMIENGTILDFVNKHGRLNEDKARRYFSQLISALDYLHNTLFICHRDLKAENVLLDRNDNLRLIDFGLSNEFTRKTPNLFTACGSPAYAAPEMIQGFPYTKATDIWSSGILLYAMAAGKLPFDDQNLNALLYKVINSEVIYPPFFSPALIDLLKRLLIKNPDQRITMQKIKELFWFSQSQYQLILTFNFSIFNQLTPDRDIINKMLSHGFDSTELLTSLYQRVFSELTSIYKQFRREKITNQMKDFLMNIQSNLQNRNFSNKFLKSVSHISTITNTPKTNRRLSRPVAVRRNTNEAHEPPERVSLDVP